jgi:hypothetical protein
MGRLAAQSSAFSTIAEATYEDRCTIRRRTITKSSDGGNLVSPQTLASNVPIRIKPSSAQEKEIAGATQASIALTVRMPALQGSELIALDSLCSLDVDARDGLAAYTLAVVAPLPSSGTKIDAVALRQA